MMRIYVAVTLGVVLFAAGGLCGATSQGPLSWQAELTEAERGGPQRFEAALVDLEKRFTQSSDLSRLMAIHATVLAEKGQTKEATVMMVSAIVIADTPPDRANVAGLLLRGQGRSTLYSFYRDLSAKLIPLVDSRETETLEQLAWTHIRAAVISGATENEVMTFIERVADKGNKEVVRSLLLKAWSLFTVRDPKCAEALSVMERSVKMCPELTSNAKFVHNHAAMLARGGRHKEALAMELRAASMTSDNSLLTSIFWGAANEYVEVGDLDASEQFLVKCEEACRSKTDKDEWLKQIKLQREINAIKRIRAGQLQEKK